MLVRSLVRRVTSSKNGPFFTRKNQQTLTDTVESFRTSACKRAKEWLITGPTGLFVHGGVKRFLLWGKRGGGGCGGRGGRKTKSNKHNKKNYDAVICRGSGILSTGRRYMWKPLRERRAPLGEAPAKINTRAAQKHSSSQGSLH